METDHESFGGNLRAYNHVSPLTIFGLTAVIATLVFYALEKRSHWFILAFAATCVFSSIYGFLQGAWPFGGVEIAWTIVALRRWWVTVKSKRIAKPVV